MALNPLKVFLFVLGGTVAAAATAFYSGALHPDTAASVRNLAGSGAGAPAAGGSAAMPTADTQTAAGKQAKPGQQGGTGPTLSAIASEVAGDASTVASADGATQPAVSSAAPAGRKQNAVADPALSSASAAQGRSSASNPPKAVETNQLGTSAPLPSGVAADSSGAGRDPAASSESSEPSVAGQAAEPAGQQASLVPLQESATSGRAGAVPRAGSWGAAGGDSQAPVQAAPQAAPQAAAEASAPAVPSFDILRVEPDGSTVVAGRSVPGARVEMMVADKTLSTTTAGTDGDFAIVLDEPLKPGDHQIQLKSTAPDGHSQTSTQTALVSIPQDKSGQVLAMVDEPGAPSRLLTVPEAPATAGGGSAAGRRDAASSEAGNGAAARGETSSGAAGRSTGDAGTQQQTASSPPEDGTTASGAASPGGAAPDASGGAAGPVSVQAVEIEGRRIFVAGLAKPGSTVRVYAGAMMLGDAVTSAGGEFLVEATGDLLVGSYTVRADMLGSAGVVVARAEVPFEREAGENVAAVAPGLDKAGERKARPSDLSAGSGSAASAGSAGPATPDAAGTGVSEISTAEQPAGVAAAGDQAATPGKAIAGAANPQVGAEAASSANEPPDATSAGVAGTVDGSSDEEEAGLPAAGTQTALLEETEAGPGEPTLPAPRPQPASSETAASARNDASGDPGSVAVANSRPSAAGGSAAGAAPRPPAKTSPRAVPPAGSVASAAASGRPIASLGNVAATGRSGSADRVEPRNEASDPAVPSSGDQAAEGSGVAVNSDGPQGADMPLVEGDSDPAASSAESGEVRGGAMAAGTVAEAPSPARDGAASQDVASATAPGTGTASGGEADAVSGGAVFVTAGPRLQPVDTTVIIRRGDSLWRISRRIYGFGTRYSTIYLANLDQIRNPDLIMPGQVFAVPSQSQQGEAADLKALGDQQAVKTP